RKRQSHPPRSPFLWKGEVAARDPLELPPSLVNGVAPQARGDGSETRTVYSRGGYNGGKSVGLARGGFSFTCHVNPCANAIPTAEHAAAASPSCQRVRCKASNASRCTGSDNALRNAATLAMSGWSARAQASNACSHAAASPLRAASNISACNARWDFDTSFVAPAAARATSTETLPFVEACAFRRISHHVTTAAITSSHNARLASATTRQNHCAPAACGITVAAGTTGDARAAIPEVAELVVGAGATVAAPPAIAPLTCRVRASTLACSARSCATSHQSNVMAGSDSLPLCCGTIAKLRVRVPCNHWPLSSVLSRVWSGYTRAPVIIGNSGSGNASAGCPVALMLKVTVNGTPTVTSPFAGNPASFNCTSRAGSQ